MPDPVSPADFEYFLGEVLGSGVVRSSARPWEVSEVLQCALASIGIRVHPSQDHQEASLVL